VGITVLAVLAFGVGAGMVVATLLSAIMTLVVPRALPVMITRWVFIGIRTLFRLRGGRARSFEARDRDLALYGPISLFSLAATWLILTGIGYTLLFWSLGDRPLRQALVLSGSSIYTLGFEVPPNMPTTLLAFSEAGVGLVLLAMLISYLPSMYQSFQRREAAEAGVPLKADLEQAWRDFAGWRVNYDRVLLALAALTMAPYAPWSSDRSMIERNGPRNRRRSRSGT
jgi:hypothetical protein